MPFVTNRSFQVVVKTFLSTDAVPFPGETEIACVDVVMTLFPLSAVTFCNQNPFLRNRANTVSELRALVSHSVLKSDMVMKFHLPSWNTTLG